MPACFSKVFKPPQFFPQCTFMCPGFFNHCFSLYLLYKHTHTLAHSTPTTQVYFWTQEFLPSWLFLPPCWFFILTPQCPYFFFSFIGSRFLFLIGLICNRVFCFCFCLGYSLIWCRCETFHEPPQHELLISKWGYGVSFCSVVVITLA